MIDIKNWMKDFVAVLDEAFGDRIIFAGLQGSYGRGEATEDSDIDVVVIFDQLHAADLDIYDQAVSKLPYRELLCGFVSGQDELKNWEIGDLFQFCADTTAYRGDLESIVPLGGKEAAQRAALSAGCNLYHGCVHNILHEKSDDILRDLYKTAAFAVRAVHYLKTGIYIKESRSLIRQVMPKERAVLDGLAELKDTRQIIGEDFDRLSERLLCWAAELIREYGEMERK